MALVVTDSSNSVLHVASMLVASVLWLTLCAIWLHSIDSIDPEASAALKMEMEPYCSYSGLPILEKRRYVALSREP